MINVVQFRHMAGKKSQRQFKDIIYVMVALWHVKEMHGNPGTNPVLGYDITRT